MTAPSRFDASKPTVRLTVHVSERVFANLDAMARKAGRTPALQAQLLFDAAYAARCKPTGDRDLDEAVAAIDAPPPSSAKAVEALTEEWRGSAVLGAGEVAAPVTVPEIIPSMPGIADMAAMMKGAWPPRLPSGGWDNPAARRPSEEEAFERAIDDCCRDLGVTRGELLSRSRAPSLVVGRLELYWSGTHQHGLSSPVIGRLMGGKDHTTVLSGRDRMTRLLGASGCRSVSEGLLLTPSERRRLAMRFITPDDQPPSAGGASTDEVLDLAGASGASPPLVTRDEVAPSVDADGGVAVPPLLVPAVCEAAAGPVMIRGPSFEVETGAGAPPPAPALPPAEPSAAQAKLIRQLGSIGNTPTEIADIMGLPADQVRAVLGQGKRR